MNPFRFSTKYIDSETSLAYFGYRYYNPDTGRWINRDPIGEMGGANLYLAISNDPVTSIDSLGQKSGKCFLCRDRRESRRQKREARRNRRADRIKSFKNHFKYDSQGRELLSHFLTGNGFSKYIDDDPEWSSYMMDNELLRGELEHELRIKSVNMCKEGVKEGTIVKINERVSVVMENGEGIIGYHYLHGPNTDVGGFRMWGTATVVNNKCDECEIRFDLRYIWNDVMEIMSHW